MEEEEEKQKATNRVKEKEKEKEQEVIVISSDEEEDDSNSGGGGGVRMMFCLKKKCDDVAMKMIEEAHDCFVLDFDPFEEMNDCFSNLSLNDRGDDVSLVAAKGKVACKDYAHSRHLCANYPFNTTPHESYCSQCFCYVCDSPAPCEKWKGLVLGHCHASDRTDFWKELRENRKLGKKSPRMQGRIQRTH